MKPKLADSISLGAMLRPQAFGTYYDSFNGGTCGMGAALEAAGIPISALAFKPIFPLSQRMWAWAYGPGRYPCPAGKCHFGPTTAHYLITHLNDTHRWTRERQAADMSTPVIRGQRSEQ